MKKIVKRVLGIGMLVGLLFVSLGNVDAAKSCNRMDSPGNENVEYKRLSGGKSKTNLDLCLSVSKNSECELYFPGDFQEKNRKECLESVDSRLSSENRAHADLACEAEMAKCDDLQDSQVRNKCRAAANKKCNAADKCNNLKNPNDINEIDKKRTNKEICDNAQTKAECGKFFTGGLFGNKDKCEDAVRKKDKAANKVSTEDLKYDPFGSYSGPSFSGPGLKAGSQIAKTKIDNSISKERSVQKLAIGWVNFALSIIAVVAVIAIIYAGMLYMTSMGDDGNKDKAKDIIMYVAIGVLLIYGSYAIVNALLSADAGGVKVSILDVLLTV